MNEITRTPAEKQVRSNPLLQLTVAINSAPLVGGKPSLFLYVTNMNFFTPPTERINFFK